VRFSRYMARFVTNSCHTQPAEFLQNTPSAGDR
jgi:hypothetical protein